MIVLGIDPGLQVCGYAVVKADGSDCRLLEAGVIRTDRRLSLPKRLAQIAEDLGDLLKSARPAVVAVEELYSHYAHPRTAVLMGHARGVILLQAVQSGAELRSFSATRIKKSLTGNGRASKLQMQRTIQSVLGLPHLPEPPDVADAVAAAMCCVRVMATASLR
jgi:crossover junction endodeoxyribonuclease RuvC